MTKTQVTVETIRSSNEARESLFPISKKYPIEFQEIFELFLDALIGANKSMNTVKSYYFDTKIFLDFIAEKYPEINTIKDIQTKHLTLFRKFLQVERKNKKTSLSRKENTLVIFIQFAIEQGYLAEGESPIPKQSAIKSTNKKKTTLPTFLELPEVKEFFDVVNKKKNPFLRTRDSLLFGILFYTGLRISEAQSLDVLDLKEALSSGILTITGKGDKTRTVPLSEEIIFGDGFISDLNEYLTHRAHYMPSEDGPLFVSTRGQRITVRAIQLNLNKYIKNTSISKNISPHKFRHSFATHLVKNGAPLIAIQELLGHSSLETSRIYTHVNNDDLSRAVNKFSPRLSDSET